MVIMLIIPKEVAFLNFRNWLVGGIIVTSIIGLGSLLFRNPSRLLMQLLFMGLIAVFIYLVFRFTIGKRQNHSENRSYIKAAKFSQKRYRQSPKSVSTNKAALKKPLRKRSTAHLTVIEGKKNKKKDRAIF